MSDFILSELLANYARDEGFTGSSMNKAIEAARELEDRVWPWSASSGVHRRLSALLVYMQLGHGFSNEDLLVASRWAKSLEDWAAARPDTSGGIALRAARQDEKEQG